MTETPPPYTFNIQEANWNKAKSHEARIYKKEIETKANSGRQPTKTWPRRSSVYAADTVRSPRPRMTPRSPVSPRSISLPPAVGLQKEEMDSKNSNPANEASRLPLGQALILPEKRASTTSNSEYEELNTHVSQRGFYKRNLHRYSWDHWLFQRCHIGRP
ncbi:testis-expressed protein 48 isoform X1 [Suricata suricatta]|uniref:testis-expressed protein 48 isoform X1 n=1 Tax=Suricata suricatta TaxID=37032 RepID=UPI00115533E4|nr:testis-expressed protein 48 isoform X1 [Suricata suricatta]